MHVPISISGRLGSHKSERSVKRCASRHTSAVLDEYEYKGNLFDCTTYLDRLLLTEPVEICRREGCHDGKFSVTSSAERTYIHARS